MKYSLIKSCSVLLLLLLCSFSSIGQDYLLSGYVSDKSGEKLVGVHVFVSEDNGTITDRNGYYQLALKKGTYQLQARFIGYTAYVAVVDIEQSLKLDLELIQSSELLDDVVITAGRSQHKRSEVAVSMEVLKPDMLAIIPHTDMEANLKMVPGLNMADGQVGIRSGAGYSYGAGSRVMVLYDHLPLLSADAGDVKWNFIPSEHIQRIEIIKGAASSLYGSGALNGVINVISAWPDAKPYTKVSLTGGSYLTPKRKELKWWGDTSLTFQSIKLAHRQQYNQLDLVTELEVFRDEGYRTDNEENRYQYSLKLRYRHPQIKGFNFGVGTIFAYEDKSDFFLWENSAEGAYIQLADVVNPTISNRMAIDPFVNFETGDWKHALRSRYFFSKNDVLEDAKDNQSASFYNEYTLNRSFKNDLRLVSGLSFLVADNEAQLYGNHTSSNYAFFAQLEKKFFDRLLLSAGVRSEWFQLDEEKGVSDPLSRVGLNYQLFAHTFLRASYGQAYRFPTIAEKFTYTQVGGLQVLPNPFLEPETGWNTEFGIRQELGGDHFQSYIDFAVFHTEYHNMMEFTFGVVDSVTYLPIFDISEFGTHPVGFQSRNVGEANVTGVELSFGMNGNFGSFPFKMIAGYTYTNPVDLNTDSIYQVWKSTDDAMLKYRFKHGFNMTSSLSYKDWSLGYSLLYNSHIVNIDRFFELGLVLPGLKTYREENNSGTLSMDASLSYNYSDHLQLVIACRNFTNNEYMVRPGDIAPPRNVMIKLIGVF